mgnify:CR=1 FL=1
MGRWISQAKTGVGIRSLRFRVGLLILGIAVVAASGMSGLTYIADSIRADAAAINVAGSLRMQAFQVALLLREDAGHSAVGDAAQRFGETLSDSRLTRALEHGDESSEAAYKQVVDDWRRFATTVASDPVMAIRYLDAVSRFVTHIDAMVSALQAEAESRVRLLWWAQAAVIALILSLAMLAMLQLQDGLSRPLARLGQAVRRASSGNRGVRVEPLPDNEIGVIADHFNHMVAHLERLQVDLESEVDSKSMALRRSNQSLMLLYDLTCGLVPLELDDQTIEPLLERLRRIIGLRSVNLEIRDPSAMDRGIVMSASRPGGDAWQGSNAAHESSAHTCISLSDGKVECGALIAASDADKQLTDMDRQLLEAVAERFSWASRLARASREQQILSLMEERAVIARELHDSLAQALSYLKIQVARLRSQITLSGQASPETEAMLDELRTGLTAAYQDLRELLATFRLRVDEPDLELALRSTVSECARRSPELAIGLAFSETQFGLTPHGTIHMLHIVREALANIVRHSSARNATVALFRRGMDGPVVLRIDDDGIGINPETDMSKIGHYGLAIMRERAERLGGVLSIQHPETGGTRIEVEVPTG